MTTGTVPSDADPAVWRPSLRGEVRELNQTRWLTVVFTVLASGLIGTTAAVADRGVFAEFACVTRPGAPVVAFQSGEGERVDRTTSYGDPVPLTYDRHRLEEVVDALISADFAMHAVVRREPSLAHETTPQAFLLAQRWQHDVFAP